MQELLLGYAREMWRFKWQAVVVAWLAAGVGWFAVWMMPDEYEASARIHVDTDTILTPLLRGLAVDQENAAARLSAMTRVWLSRANREEISRRSDLDHLATTEEEREKLLQWLGEAIQLEAVNTGIRSPRPEPPRLFRVLVRHSDAHVARKVVQASLEVFMERSLGDARQDSSVAQDFLERQIAEYEGRLEMAENRLREFKRRHIDVLPEQGRSYFDGLQVARSREVEAELEIKQLQQRRAALQVQIEQARKGTAIGGAQAVLSPLDERILALERRLDELLLKYTTEHPDYVETKESLDALKKQRSSAGAQQASLQSNPIYQELRLTLGGLETELAAARVRRDEYAQRVATLQSQLENLPQVEAELQRLNRDYEVNRENYNALIARRESAKISQDVGKTGESVKFKVVDPPVLPTAPIAPNRILLYTMVLLGAFGGGIGATILLGQTRPALYQQRVLHDVTGLPVLGTVSLVWDDAMRQRRTREIGAVTAALGLLVVAYGAVLADQLLGRSGAQRVMEYLQAWI